jgi:hypothetical protein
MRNSKNSIPKESTCQSVKNWAYELNGKFSNKEIQMTNKYMNKCSTSLVIKEIQIKTTLRFHLIPVRMATFKSNNNKIWQGCQPLYTVSGNVN